MSHELKGGVHIYTLDQNLAHVGECLSEEPGSRPGKPALRFDTYPEAVEHVLRNKV